jgi:hypothetical protein
MPDVCGLTLTTGNPDDLASIAQSWTWTMPADQSSVDGFAAEMTQKWGEPVRTLQPAGDIGTDERFVVLDPEGETA